MSQTKPIGIFDSGIGGLTVANAVISRLPKEQIIYFGDTVHLPYGDKSKDSINYYALRITRYLLDKGCKAIVIACNTASAAAYRTLVDFFDRETIIVNVVDPLVEAAIKRNARKVGIIGTKLTIESGVYQQQLHTLAPEMEVTALPTPLLAPMIEEGFINNSVSNVVLKEYLHHAMFDGMDALLLACTHYALIKPQIQDLLPGVEIIDTADTTARYLQRQLSEHQLLNTFPQQEEHHFIVSDFTPTFEETTALFFKDAVHLEEDNIWRQQKW